MHLLHAVLMGVVQGLSEFLPISSSGHLVIFSNLYKNFNGIEISPGSNEEIVLDIMLHLGTLIAVLIFFRKDIANIIKGFVIGIKERKFNDGDFKTGLYIIIGTIITVCVAFPLCDLSEKLVFMPAVVGLFLIITGSLLLFSEYYSKRRTEKRGITLLGAIVTGIAQGLASFPGFSRSGFTIATGMLSGADRMTAARYSFLLSVPIILGASMVYPLVKVDMSEFLSYNWISIITGTMVSGVVGYFCIKYFLNFISKFSIRLFGYYCIIIGIVSFLFFK